MHILINALILFLPLMSLLWHDKHLASYAVMKKYFHIQKTMHVNAELQVLDDPIQPIGDTSLTAQTGLTDVSAKGDDSAMKVDKIMKAEVEDPGRHSERNIRRAVFKYVLIGDELFC